MRVSSRDVAHRQTTREEATMMKLFKSDLTYSLGGGFIAGAVLLFSLQPADQPADLGQTQLSTVSAVSPLPS